MQTPIDLPLPAILALAALGLYATARRAHARKIDDLRRIGIYPAEGQGTDAHVKVLAERGEHAAAVRLYRELHGVSAKDAKKAVEQLVLHGS